MTKVRFTAASQPDEVLALALIRSDTVHSQKVYDVSWKHLVGHLAIQLPKHLLLAEVPRIDQPHAFVLELNISKHT